MNLRLCSKNEYTKSESNSQLFTMRQHCSQNCVQRTNIQNLKAIHNDVARANFATCIVFKERIYKIWKQFTTWNPTPTLSSVLCSKNEYTKSESNSQLGTVKLVIIWDCVQRTNIQNLKAIHNPPKLVFSQYLIVFKERIYKIWKQFTTGWRFSTTPKYCVQRTNIQNLKAIHNMASRT